MDFLFLFCVCVRHCRVPFCCAFWSRVSRHSNGTLVNLQFEDERSGEENKVEEEHCDAEGLVHSPSETGDAQHDEAQHAEQHQHRAGHSRAVDRHRRAEGDRIEEPR